MKTFVFPISLEKGRTSREKMASGQAWTAAVQTKKVSLTL
jgi:hypothetical protein